MRLKSVALVTALTAGILALALSVEGQSAGKVYRIGVLASAQPPESMMAAFRLGLREHGYVDGQNVRIEQRWTEGTTVGLSEFAEEIVRSNVDLIFTWGTPATLAAKRATAITPIVMVGVADPVGSGLVVSLAQPGGNTTGVSNIARDLMGKILELLKEAVPGATRIAALRNAANPSTRFLVTETETAARSLRMRFQLVEVQRPDDLAGAFAAMVRERAGAAIVLPDPMFINQRGRIAELALKSRVPMGFNRREYADVGGLLSYGPGLGDQARYAAKYVDRIFKGAKPADLAVEQPTRLELVINVKTATALGLTIPPSLLRRADEIIQ